MNASLICCDDGKSYLEKCELNRTRCESTEVIQVNHKGQCIKTEMTKTVGSNRMDECDSIICGLGMRCKACGHQERLVCICSNLCPPTTSEVCRSDNIVCVCVCVCVRTRVVCG